MQFNLQTNDITDDSVNARGQEVFDIKNNLECDACHREYNEISGILTEKVDK